MSHAPRIHLGRALTALLLAASCIGLAIVFNGSRATHEASRTLADIQAAQAKPQAQLAAFETGADARANAPAP